MILLKKLHELLDTIVLQLCHLKLIKIINIDKDFKHLEQNIKNLLIKHGFYEVINNPFVKSKAPHAIKVDNPLDSNRKYLRTNLKNSLIDNLLYNERRQQDSVKLFEISDIYYTDEK